MAEQDGLAPMDASEPCPHDCPCGAERKADFSQQEPSRLIGKVGKAEGFTRKNKNGREADRRLANHRLQPLGHLTAARMLSIDEIATYAPADCPLECP
jgi:hypothetical protein